MKRPWRERWFDDSIAPLAMRAWRGVAAQHVVATMRLVDTLEEQAVLEALLDAAEPALPPAAAGKHPLLTAPFRYRPRHPGRFRRAGGSGVWYGAETLRTACAEVAYWRWRFVTDSAGLASQEVLTEHTFFSAAVQGRAIDLQAAPWKAAHAHWAHPLDYTATQALADAARGQGVQWIAYVSVRDPGGRCAAVLDVAALDAPDLAGAETWHCRATATSVRLVHGRARHEWRFPGA